MSENIGTAQTIILFLAGVLATVLNYVGLDKEVYFIYCLLLIIDYVTGIGRAYRLGISITSREMRIGMISKMSLLTVPIILGLGFKVVGADGAKALEIGMIILSLSEVYSSISNIHAIKTTKDLPEFDALASLARWLKSKIMLYEDGK